MSDTELSLAVENIINSRLGEIQEKPFWLIYGQQKHRLATEFKHQLENRDGLIFDLSLPEYAYDTIPEVTSVINDLVNSRSKLILLLTPSFVHSNLMKLIGRPDKGVLVNNAPYCDWSLSEESFARIYSADQDEILKYRKDLSAYLYTDSEVRITTKMGTDISFSCRHWNMQNTEEVNTSPKTDTANGIIIYDGSIFWGEPKQPVTVKIVNGRITKIKCNDTEDPQFNTFRDMIKTDENANVLAEFGIGLNPNAIATGHGMEAEMSRYTCHLDFGNSIPYGGNNRSGVHYGGTILNPTLTVSRRLILNNGKFVGNKIS